MKARISTTFRVAVIEHRSPARLRLPRILRMRVRFRLEERLIRRGRFAEVCLLRRADRESEHADPAEVSIALRLVLSIEGVEYRRA